MTGGAQNPGGGPLAAVSRCRDAGLIELIFERDYFDDPIRSFPAPLRRAFAGSWCAKREEVYLVVGDVGGERAGFVLAHTLGDRLFKGFARAHPRHLPALAWAALRMKLSRAEPYPEAEGPSDPAGRAAVDEQVAALGIRQTGRPFAWSPADGRTGRISLLYVDASYRGHGLARRMLDRVAGEMRAGGAHSVEAHINPYNLPSVRAFLKSGYEVSRTAGGDFFARKSLAG